MRLGVSQHGVRMVGLGLPVRLPTARAVQLSMANDLARFHRDDARAVRNAYRAENLPGRLPAFDEWFVDTRAWIWIGRDEFSESPHREYVAFSFDGQRRLRLVVPLFSRIVDASRGETILVTRDDDGLRRIEVRALVPEVP
jgi:hypothetical protein